MRYLILMSLFLSFLASAQEQKDLTEADYEKLERDEIGREGWEFKRKPAMWQDFHGQDDSIPKLPQIDQTYRRNLDEEIDSNSMELKKDGSAVKSE